MNFICENADTIRNVILAVWFVCLVVWTVTDVRKDGRNMPLWKKVLYHTFAVGVKNPGGTVSSALRANARDILRLIGAILLIGVILYALGVISFIK